jgi:hypothetical protein
VAKEPLHSSAWAPPACTLPTVEQPLRLAEFDTLFATGLEDLERPTPTLLQLRLAAELESTARDLTAREAHCCSFFTFTFTTNSDGSLLLAVTVTEPHTAVLDTLTLRTISYLPS